MNRNQAKAQAPHDEPNDRCYCWDLRLPHIHSVRDHQNLSPIPRKVQARG